MNQIGMYRGWLGRLKHFLRGEKCKKTAFGRLLQFIANVRRSLSHLGNLRYKLANFAAKCSKFRHSILTNYINFNRRHADIGKIHLLAKDVDCVTSEIYLHNAFYGHATIIKKYGQVPKQYQLKCLIEHGVYFGGYISEDEINFPLPSLFTFGRYRKTILERKTDKHIFMIGPVIMYANHYLNEEKRQIEKNRLGKNLLVFPAHSTHHILAHFNIDKYCDKIRDLGKGFDSIRICLYWKDILRGFDKAYSKYGFECITAGHIYDPMFLPRLKTIIDVSTVTTSNQLGSQVGYCIALGKPHFLNCEEIEYTGKPGIPMPAKEIDDYWNQPDIVEVARAFNEFKVDISTNQMEVADTYWGISEYKSVDEMKQLLETTEALYKERTYSRPTASHTRSQYNRV